MLLVVVNVVFIIVVVELAVEIVVDADYNFSFFNIGIHTTGVEGAVNAKKPQFRHVFLHSKIMF